MSELHISTDKNLLDIPFIHNFLTHSYWAEGRSMELVQRSIDNSICFGAYINGKQVGFARVVTDLTVFVYIMDVFIDEAYRGRGYGLELMEAILAYPELSSVKQWRLATRDAHGLYAKLGFTPLLAPDRWMQLNR